MAATEDLIDYDPEAGRKAFQALETTLRDLPDAQLTPATAKVGLATAFVLRVAREVKAERSAYEALPGIDKALVYNLEPAAWAAWYIQTELDDSQAVKTGVKVPQSIVEPATERRTRMLRVLDYHFGDEPRVARRLESIRAGQGYDDLASDLARLARLYQRYAPDLPLDDKWYDPDDARQANLDVKAILESLATQTENDWPALRMRAWSYLLRCYNEVSSAAQWLHRNDPEAASRFASLYSVARPGSGRRSTPSAPPPEAAREAVIDA